MAASATGRKLSVSPPCRQIPFRRWRDGCVVDAYAAEEAEGATGKSFRSYREIAWGLQENPFRNTGFLRCLNVGSKVWAVKREKGGFQGGFGRKKGW